MEWRSFSFDDEAFGGMLYLCRGSQSDKSITSKTISFFVVIWIMIFGELYLNKLLVELHLIVYINLLN